MSGDLWAELHKLSEAGNVTREHLHTLIGWEPDDAKPQYLMSSTFFLPTHTKQNLKSTSPDW
jgi:hypothetical protein